MFDNLKKFINSKNQLDNLKKIIDANIDALTALIKQSDQLNDVISSLEGKDNCKETRNSLEEIKENISDSIGKLIDQTKDLTETYSKLVKLNVA
jgi:K+/H+ antiporter YhaU regulatory subunit KhtT